MEIVTATLGVAVRVNEGVQARRICLRDRAGMMMARRFPKGSSQLCTLPAWCRAQAMVAVNTCACPHRCQVRTQGRESLSLSPTNLSLNTKHRYPLIGGKQRGQQSEPGEPLDHQAEDSSGSRLGLASSAPPLAPAALLSGPGSVRGFGGGDWAFSTWGQGLGTTPAHRAPPLLPMRTTGSGAAQFWAGIQQHQLLSDPPSLPLCHGDTGLLPLGWLGGRNKI